MIVQHNWMWTIDRRFQCCGADHFRKPDGAQCIGCGALLPVWFADTYNEMDRLWHEKYRPMAALCGLVEEANDQA